MKFIKIAPIFLFLMMMCSCSSKKSTDNKVYIKVDTLLAALPKKVTFPRENPYSKEKAELGKLLFFDPILSGNKDVACATCHHPKNGFAEFRDISIGVNGKGFAEKRVFNTPNNIPFVKRNAHTILNTAFNGISHNNINPENAPMFWDNRVNSLEDQALEPIKAMEEMKGLKYNDEEILAEIIKRLNRIPYYKNRFKEIFNDKITSKNIAKAIATYERTLITNDSRFDRYMRGDSLAISLGEKRGLQVFKAVGCINCHNGPMLSDFKIHVLSAPENSKLVKIDSGFNNSFGFRTPTLRNLRYTAPYMHNGTLPTLKKVMEFYEDLTFKKSRNLNISIHNVDTLATGLTIRMKDFNSIISFLNTLNDENFDKTIPNEVPSGLAVGGNIKN